MIQNAKEIPELLKCFRHKTAGYVKFHEVDSFKVVHNLKYLEWTEVARVEYCQAVGISILPDANNNLPYHNSIFVVHSEINYFNPASYFDKYEVYTRVSHLGNTSMTFEHVVVKADGTPLCINQIVEVYVGKELRPIEIDTHIKDLILNYENKGSIEIYR